MRRKKNWAAQTAFWLSISIAATVILGFAGAQEDKTERLDGYMFSRLHHIGSESEGPTYFLQKFDYEEIVVIKQTNLWEEDPCLHKFLGKKVTVEGEMSSSGIVYEKIMDYLYEGEMVAKETLEIALEVGTDTLWINKMPPGSHAAQQMNLTLLVKWPYRSNWQGSCPTPKKYDFSVDYQDYRIWEWSKDKIFLQVKTPIELRGGHLYKFSEVWQINSDVIGDEGTYTAGAVFVATGQRVWKEFEVRFAH